MQPTAEHLKDALAEAERMCDAGEDEHFVGHSLLYFAERDKLTARIIERLELFIRFGMSTRDLSHLRKALEALERFDEHAKNPEAREEEDLNL